MALKNMTAMSRIIRLQFMTGMIGGVFLLLLGHAGFALAFVYGVLLMSINAWWLGRRLESTSEMNAEASQRSIFAGAALRFVALIVGLLLGQWMGFHLMLVAAGIFVAQVLVYMFALFALKKEQF